MVTAAAILPDGLFLTYLTLIYIKDPMLIGISNQIDLRDEEPKTDFVIEWTANRKNDLASDPCLSKIQ